MKPGVTYSVGDMLEGQQETPVMPGPNPHRLWTDEWFEWKEVHEDYRPYHTCETMPRLTLKTPDLYRCPACGKEFPTYTAKLRRSR